MSLASDWAAQLAAEAGKVATVEAQKPPAYVAGNMNATVTPGGGLKLDREADLTAGQALSLGQWIVATYG